MPETTWKLTPDEMARRISAIDFQAGKFAGLRGVDDYHPAWIREGNKRWNQGFYRGLHLATRAFPI